MMKPRLAGRGKVLRQLLIVSGLLFLLGEFGQSSTIYPYPTWAAGIVVETTADELDGNPGNGLCSLREAIANANNNDAGQGDCEGGVPGHDIISFNAGVTGTIALATGQLSVTDDLTINGPGAGVLAVDGNGTSRVLWIDGAEVNILGLTISGGAAFDGAGIYNLGGAVTLENSSVSGNNGAGQLGAGLGGGIRNDQGTLTLNNSNVVGNGLGGAVSFFGGGGIADRFGTVTLNNSTVSGNKASFGGGGLYTRSGTIVLNDSEVIENTAREGAGISVDWFELSDVANVTLNRSKVSRNSATDAPLEGRGGGISSAGAVITLNNSSVTNNVADVSGGGMILAGDTVTLNDSTVSGNTSGAVGGGISASRCFPCQSVGHVTLNRSTISVNSAYDPASGEGRGGGIFNLSSAVTLNNSTISGNSAHAQGGGIFNWSTLVLANSTVAGNSAGTGGGIFSELGTTALTNTIVADSAAGDCSGAVISNGHNLDSDGSCGLAAVGDISSGTANLGPLQDNGGATFTHELLTGSQAIDAADDASCAAAPISGLDQREVLRPQGAHCDIGTFELVQPITLAIDIKPGGDPNSINCGNEDESITVTILTTNDFDVTAVDHTTVLFEGASETHVRRQTGEPKRHDEEDLDEDGDIDLEFHFRLGDSHLTCNSTEGVLTGETFDGQAIAGIDSVRMVRGDSG
jgi:CSLREA domain-containing protein